MTTELSDTDIRKNILNINRSRKRAVYYRPVTVKDEVKWIETLPLPSDPEGRMYYLAKGFRTEIPKEEIKKEVVEGVPCPHCDFVAKDDVGFLAHFRSHLNKSKATE